MGIKHQNYDRTRSSCGCRVLIIIWVTYAWRWCRKCHDVPVFILPPHQLHHRRKSNTSCKALRALYSAIGKLLPAFTNIIYSLPLYTIHINRPSMVSRWCFCLQWHVIELWCKYLAGAILMASRNTLSRGMGVMKIRMSEATTIAAASTCTYVSKKAQGYCIRERLCQFLLMMLCR